jgi:hypothetical protein
VQQLNGMCLGFYEENRNGHHIIGHGGDTVYFHSDLHLVLDAGVGFFVSYNSQGKREISGRTALWNHFLDRYFAYAPPAAEKPGTAAADAKLVAGRYMSSRRSESNFLKVANALDQTEVKPQSDGTIKVEGLKDFNGEEKTWEEIGPLLYRSLNGQDLLAFRRDDKGRLQLLPNFPAIIYQKTSVLNNGLLNQVVIICSIVVLALTLVFWPVGAVVRSHYHHRLELDSKNLQGRLWIRLVCGVDLVFILAMALTLSSDDLAALSEKTDFRIHLIQIIGALGAVGTVPVLIACFRSWKDRNLWWWSKFWFVWFAIYWNALDFNLNY